MKWCAVGSALCLCLVAATLLISCSLALVLKKPNADLCSLSKANTEEYEQQFDNIGIPVPRPPVQSPILPGYVRVGASLVPRMEEWYWSWRIENQLTAFRHPPSSSAKCSVYIVTGLPRSGTTVTGEVLSRLEHIKMVHEPFNPSNRLVQLCNGFRPQNNGFPLQCQWTNISLVDQSERSKYNSYLRTVVNKCCPKDVVYTQEGIEVEARKGMLIVKDPTILGSIEWLVEEVDLRGVVVIRHPAAIINSWKQLGMSNAHSIQSLVETYLQRMKVFILPLWMKYWADERFIFSRHEDYCRDAQTRITDLYTFLWEDPASVDTTKARAVRVSATDVEPVIEDPLSQASVLIEKEIKGIRAVVNNKSAQSTKSRHRFGETNLSPSSQVNTWQNELSADEIQYIREHTEEVWRVFYSDEDW